MNARDKSVPEHTSAGFTRCWSDIVPHILVGGIMLTPRLERYRANKGWKVREIDGWPVAERDAFDRIIYATPGGGAYVP